ncbi:MAG: hypothetical protein BIP78_0726 [Candidatus Bipolaricaulis sibiricus]|uniref:Uncharacterized protein n=1 Tax=Bipolaricaulis sibiricus TaxID=2501609 RepID=A0A410FU27_BIPS1|nr:MAG: hypothetical protein BIP78_0726 [Candidatus Bipolaricaulis sibiricus]
MHGLGFTRDGPGGYCFRRRLRELGGWGTIDVRNRRLG